MKTEILKTDNLLLKNIIQYYIFFKSEKNEIIDYTTFPNTNLCLSIYKKSKIAIAQKKEIRHLLTMEGNQAYTSYLSGFYESNLHVNINVSIDEVCIIFHPSALRMFSSVPYEELLSSDEVFQMLFPHCDPFFLERLFEEKDNPGRIQMLEFLFLQSINPDFHTDRIKEVLFTIYNDNELKVGNIAKKLSINESTLYRLFMDQIGQNPKSFLRTVRFRSVLKTLLHHEKMQLTSLAYQSDYTDQSHFIRDFKRITGHTPGKLKEKTKVQQEQLAWIYTEY